MEYFKQKIVAGEVGSSAMPHKVNPQLGVTGESWDLTVLVDSSDMTDIYMTHDPDADFVTKSPVKVQQRGNPNPFLPDDV